MEIYFLTFLQVISILFNHVLFVEFLKKIEKFRYGCYLKLFLDHTAMVLPPTLISFNYFSRLQYWTQTITTYSLILNLAVILYFVHGTPFLSKVRILCFKQTSMLIDPDKKDHIFRELSIIRGSTYILTCICILGVDLPSFEPNMRKSHFQGIGLMDVGVGLFVGLMGIKSVGSRWSQYDHNKKKNAALNIYKTAMMLIILGVIRFLVMWICKMPYSYIEYGIHSNVFIVLGISKMLGSLLDVSTHRFLPAGAVAVLLLGTHEFLLERELYQLTQVDPESSRIKYNFVKANIESIVSLPGLLALYMFSKQIGDIFYNKGSLADNSKNALKMIITSGVISGITRVLIKYGLHEESRRLCNMSYTLWMVALILYVGACIKIIIIYYMIWHEDFIHYSEKVDRFGFLYFILANLLVGVVRLLKEVVTFPSSSGPLIIYIYCTVNYICSFYLDKLIKPLGIY